MRQPITEWLRMEADMQEIANMIGAAERLKEAAAEIEQSLSRWISMSDREPPDCSSYATRSMHLMCNAGFVTIGYWYPKRQAWEDTGGVDVTRQVSHWIPLPKAPGTFKDSLQVPERDYVQEVADWVGWYVMWEEQIPKVARDAIEARLKRQSAKDSQ